MDNLYSLDLIQPSEYPFVGNEAFNLSQLLQRDYPVVPGFVVSAKALWEFIAILGESEPLLADLPSSYLYVDVDNPRQLQQVAQQIRHKIQGATLASVLASTLSEIAETTLAPAAIFNPSLSMTSPGSGMEEDAGETGVARLDQPQILSTLPDKILGSYICPRQPLAMEVSLKQVWAELFRARSLFYWQRHSIGLQQLNLAVLIQPMWDAIASGTLQINQTEGYIQATWGLGTALAKGEVVPDYYQIEIETGIVLASRLGRKSRAYGLYLEPDSLSLTENSVQAHLLSEEQQKQYTLKDKYLQQLITISQRLVADISPTFSLEWTLWQTSENSEPELQITKFSPQTGQKWDASLLRLEPSHHASKLAYSVGSTTSYGKGFTSVQVGSRPNVLEASSDSIGSNSSEHTVNPSITPMLVRGLPAAPGRVTATAHVISGQGKNVSAILSGRILVAQSVSPDWLPGLKHVAAIITEQGGITSHAGIIARELGIPCVVGAAGITQIIETGESLLVDGGQGEVYRLGTKQGFPVEKLHGSELRKREAKVNFHPFNFQNTFPIATQLLVNLSQLDSLEKIVGLPVDGVGLLRSELMMLEILNNLHPSQWQRQGHERELVERLAQLIVQFTVTLAPRPVFYRSTDWRSHEFPSLSGDHLVTEGEVNPMLGLRGTRRYLSDPASFDLELAALQEVYAYGCKNLRLILPFVRTVEEFTFCRRRVEQVGLTDNPDFQLWIMAEVPSVLFLLPDYVKAGVQGISIGTNDLTQLLLGADREQRELETLMAGCHPVVKQAIQQLIEMAKEAGIPCSICGQATVQDPELIDLLVQWGITSISVDVKDVEATYQAITRAEQRLLLDAARNKSKGLGVKGNPHSAGSSSI